MREPIPPRKQDGGVGDSQGASPIHVYQERASLPLLYEVCVVHDEKDRCLAFLLSQLEQPEFPEPLGVIYASDERDTYEHIVNEQVRRVIDEKGAGDLEALLNEGETWVVEE